MQRMIMLFVCVLCVFILNCVEGISTDPIIPEPNHQTDTMTDQDGNTYTTIKIGNQWWMAENLKVTHYRNGDTIPEWDNISTSGYCVYNFDENYADIYGYLYNWYAVNDSCNIAPEGWHVPTNEDWKELEISLGMNHSTADEEGFRGTHEGSKLAGYGLLWKDGDLKNTTAFDLSGFNVPPGGSCFSDYSGIFHGIGYGAIFWTATEDSTDKSHAWYRKLDYNSTKVGRFSFHKMICYSVRLVKDEAN